MRLPVLLLIVLALRQHAWALAPTELMGVASKGLGSLATLALLLAVYEHAPVKSALLAAVALVYAWAETQTVLACAWWIFSGPWPVAPGQPMVSAKAGFDVGAVGLLAVAILAHYAVKAYRLQNASNR